VNKEAVMADLLDLLDLLAPLPWVEEVSVESLLMELGIKIDKPEMAFE
jgi:hypothetical protein